MSTVQIASAAGKVRLGGMGPVFRPATDVSKVRLGGMGPVFR